jgi:hypothetical protein
MSFYQIIIKISISLIICLLLKFIVNKLNNLTINCIKNKNIHDLSCFTIIKKSSKNINLLYILNDECLFKNIFIKYFYLIISYFINIKIYFINFIPLNLDELLIFFSNSNISLSMSFVNDNNLTLLNNYLITYNSDLYHTQKIFFTKINEELTKKDSFLIKGLELFIKQKYFSVELLWDISFEGNTAIDIFIDLGKNGKII